MLNGSQSHLPTPPWSNAASTMTILTAAWRTRVSLAINSTGLFFVLRSQPCGILDTQATRRLVCSLKWMSIHFFFYKMHNKILLFWFYIDIHILCVHIFTYISVPTTSATGNPMHSNLCFELNQRPFWQQLRSLTIKQPPPRTGLRGAGGDKRW